jgi:hypothetical protein
MGNFRQEKQMNTPLEKTGEVNLYCEALKDLLRTFWSQEWDRTSIPSPLIPLPARDNDDGDEERERGWSSAAL